MAKADNISANEQERSMQMQDRVVLITGAASGIGAAAARAFAAEGARVVLSDINAAAGEALARELGGSFIAADVTSEEQVAAAVGFAVQQHGRLDCMVNNAGMIGVVGSRSEEHTSELQSRENLVCRLLLEKKK